MTKASPQRSSSAPAKSTFEHKDGHGSLFYDAPGVPTISGSFKFGKTYNVTGEPQVDKNQRDYTRLQGDGVSGGLFVNERKEKDTHPDFTGPIEVDGQKLRMSAWKKTIKSGQSAGQEYLSISVSEQRQREQA
jgi:hypothetical protein